ncbi:MAG TPA: ribosome maturation factor RimP [Actinomycetes bacterium]
MARAADRDSLLHLLAPVVADQGLDLEDVVVTPAGKRRLLRVVVDQDGGVGLDTVAQVSSAVSRSLDDSDVMGGLPYVLEVTSPGVDRPLTDPRHWRRATGRLVTAGLSGGGSTTGRVTAVDEQAVSLDVDGTDTRLTWAEVTEGRVQVEFNRRTEEG